MNKNSWKYGKEYDQIFGAIFCPHYGNGHNLIGCNKALNFDTQTYKAHRKCCILYFMFVCEITKFSI